MKHIISNKLMKHIYDNRNATYAPIFQTDSPIGKMKAVNCGKTKFRTENIERCLDTSKKNI